jgi:hypothetical protein
MHDQRTDVAQPWGERGLLSNPPDRPLRPTFPFWPGTSVHDQNLLLLLLLLFLRYLGVVVNLWRGEYEGGKSFWGALLRKLRGQRRLNNHLGFPRSAAGKMPLPA